MNQSSPPSDAGQLTPLERSRGALLLHRLTEFSRLLREAGIEVGPHQLLDLVETLRWIDITHRDDFYTALKCSLVSKHEQEPLFDQLFSYFWFLRDQHDTASKARPQTRAQMNRKEHHLRLPPRERQHLAEKLRHSEIEMSRHAHERQPVDSHEPARDDEGQPEGAAYSALERLRQKDFENFSWEETQEAKRLMSEMRWQPGLRTTRRKMPAHHDRFLDMRRMLRRNLRYGEAIIELTWRAPKEKPRPLVIICDISGSMSIYARLFLHFIHAITNGMHNVESFVFGTRLTRITRQLRKRDVDDAIHDVSKLVQDWSGGTRIGDALHTFNYTWSRRVLSHGAVVLLISDGWDRGDSAVLRCEMEHLQRCCHQLIWLNPLLGSPDYRPLTIGMKAALPFVDHFLPAHNLISLLQLGYLLSHINKQQPDRSAATRRRNLARWSKPVRR